MTKSKLLLGLFLTWVVLISGCVGIKPEDVARANPIVRDYLREYPNAEIRVTHFSKEEAQYFLGNLREGCENPQLAAKELYRAIIEDEASGFSVVAWIDWKNKTIDCVLGKGESICAEDESRTCGTNVGTCEYGLQHCVSGTWTECGGEVKPSEETCNGKDDDCNGSVDEGLTRTCGNNIGACRFGIQACVNGSWSICTGSVGPVSEVCNNSIDDDCNGIADDEDCVPEMPCVDGQTKACGSDIGVCQAGMQTCANCVWGQCMGSVGPNPEICNDGLDNDCDGRIDKDCCTDTDGGRNYYVKGSLVWSKGNLSYFNEDGCKVGPLSRQRAVSECRTKDENCGVTEFECQASGDYNVMWHECPQGCKDGACVPDGLDSGLIIAREGASAGGYLKQVAEQRGWEFVATSSSNPETIRSQIRELYRDKEFHYLLIVGTNDEIPFARPIHDNEGLFQRFETDPALYADIDDDGFIELSVGRIPFSSEQELRDYFTDLSPKGSNYYYEHYPLSVDDPLDEHVVKDYTYALCLNSFIPSAEVFRNSDLYEIIDHYKTATLLELRTHGTDSSFSINDEFNSFTINSLCGDCERRRSATDAYCECDEPEYLSNRPILIHLSCNNAKQLGIELMENGAGAFVGFYSPAGYIPPVFSQKLFSGMSIGDAFRDIFNRNILYSIEIEMEPGYAPIIPSLDGLNNIELSNVAKPIDPYGFVLYGDPSIRLPNTPSFTPSISVKQEENEITIEVKASELFNITEKDSLLCYTGHTVSHPSFIDKDYWGESTDFGAAHDISLNFRVAGANRLLRTAAIIDGKEIELSSGPYREFRVNLVKGTNEEYIHMLIQNPGLDYKGDATIIVIIEFHQEKT